MGKHAKAEAQGVCEVQRRKEEEEKTGRGRRAAGRGSLSRNPCRRDCRGGVAPSALVAFGSPVCAADAEGPPRQPHLRRLRLAKLRAASQGGRPADSLFTTWAA